MNQMEIFKNPEFGSVRVIEENGKYLFCGLDVTAALGYKDSAKALKAHCTSDGWAFYPLIDNVGRTQQTRFISEGNLYRLIVHSKLPSAERFERWVFDEVLPSIRKHEAYITREKLWEVATSPEAMMKLCSDLLAEREENAALREENAMLEGKAAFYDAPAERANDPSGNPGYRPTRQPNPYRQCTGANAPASGSGQKPAGEPLPAAGRSQGGSRKAFPL